MVAVPETLEDALAPDFLRVALAEVSGGLAVTGVETVEVIRTVATKVRFAVTFDGSPERQHFCLKGLLDVNPAMARSGPTMLRESDFYTQVAPKVDVRVPDCIGRVLDRERQMGVILMRDVVVAGGTFNLASAPLSVDYVARSLEQLAGLHAGTPLFADAPFIERRISAIAASPHLAADPLQQLLDGPRGVNLRDDVRSAERLLRALRLLADLDAGRPQYMIHGDCHAGNSFFTPDGPGLIDWQLLQRGGWALDVAYHVCALLTVDDSAGEERRLLDHYLDAARTRGVAHLPDREEAWLHYRQAITYGYYLWAITRLVDPALIAITVDRLGQAVGRHDSFGLVES